MEKIAFDFLGLTLLEPLSSLMNWVLAAQCAYYYSKLKGTSISSFQKYWSWFFLAYAISLLFGGVSHLFYHYLGMAGKIPNWSMALLGVSAAELAMVTDIKEQKKKQMLQAVIRSKLLASAAMLVFDFSFKWVMVHIGGLLFFVGIISFNRWRSGQPAYKFFLLGLLFLVLMAPIKIAGLDIHPAWFTRDDIAHFLMLGAFWMFYRGVSAKTT